MIHVLFENEAWLPPLEAGLKAEGLPYKLRPVIGGVIDPSKEPEPGIYLNRMSPSSHTRGHEHAVCLMGDLLAWLEHSGRRVVNGARAYSLEMSKLKQDLAMRRHGIAAPRTVMAVGKSELIAAAATFEGQFITKHNQGGKGLGIKLFNNLEQLAEHLDDPEFDPGPQNQMLIQQYIAPAEPFITRVEIVDGKFLYAMRSSTVGGFELCPSDACQVQTENCPADGSAKFSLSPLTEDDPLVQSYIKMCAAEGLDIAGIEFIEDADGRRYTYDINGTTNYSSGVERAAGVDGMREIARLLGKALVESERVA
jgi:glutathione synthase/RimK-type ligase-like ATP-grasp enzyme